MQKRVVKIKFLNLFLMLFIPIVIVFLIVSFFRLPTYNIIIKGNKYVNDEYIMQLAGIENYPSFILKSTFYMDKKITESPLIESVSIKRKFFNTFVIDVVEERPMFMMGDTIYFASGESINNNTFKYNESIPRITNDIPKNQFNRFIKGMNKIDISVLSKISEVKYDPNDIDKERYLLYMDDYNMVYLTLTKFKQINYYNDVLEQLNNRKGILYLDNGNHFQIKE